MTPKPHARLAAGSPSAIASAKAAARVPTCNSCVDRCGWSRIDTLSLVTTSPCLRDADEGDIGGGGRGRKRERGCVSGKGEGKEEEEETEDVGIFLTQLPPEVWEAGDEVGLG